MRTFLHTAFSIVILLFVGFGSVKANPTPLSPIQQMFILKKIKPDVERVGIIWTEGADAHDELMPKIKRAAASNQVKLFVAYVNRPEDVSAHFRELTGKHDIQTLWIPDDSGVLQADLARSYLIKQTTKSGIPILAPSQEWVQAGASVALRKEDGDIRIVLNEAAALATSITVPDEFEDQALYLSKK